jgi:hypothetical protein
MSKIPPAMKQNRRFADAHFVKSEYLYRRVPLDFWADAADDLEVNAIELPDISCGRSKYGHPEWLRFDVRENGVYIFRDGWAVIGFQIGDIPSERWLDGVFRFTFKTVHDPDEWNYPHSEVRSFEDEVHIDVLGVCPRISRSTRYCYFNTCSREFSRLPNKHKFLHTEKALHSRPFPRLVGTCSCIDRNP